MALASMTGFGHAEGGDPGLRFQWELRSVNGRGLDMRLRLAPGFEHLEQGVRAAITGALKRGNVQASLAVKREQSAGELRLNEEAFEQVLAVAEAVRKRVGANPISVEGLLSLRGVLEFADPEADEAQVAARDGAVMAALQEALAQLARARGEEGARLVEVLAAQIDRIAELADAARALSQASPEGLRRRLVEGLKALLALDPPVGEERLAQELALQLVKADVREELDRLDAHCAAARDLLRADEPVGRRFEFLVQELQREANTLCSKSSELELTRLGLELKAVIDQVREQVQNLE
ncbi:MAG: YicC family protein [Alphaproteobacteria bacterium]|nr:YicC family protein [Alphaproteobacteria bacterium]